MRRNLASSVLSVLLYAQALLAFAGLATVVLDRKAEVPPAVMAQSAGETVLR